ncbi:DUF4178 domain-containing protein [Hymenobacter yonginensis]|uniref:DUF4178 domain-containing protein n=1 Tax=Hymenobacter yonginensis TaxID=748197 RepID=A0ABY7PQL3_9BACT|nr:DUF4178 domain-containing protein [Hymenobacter yonginensis]WBO85216.1 DUF4178 domain-containing protein [Hymenobacter yonginensis]
MSETTTAPVAPAQLPCPRCQHSVPYFDQLNSAFFVCPECHTYFEADDRAAKPLILGKFQGDSTLPIMLPLGTVGTLRGQPYRVLGFQLRREKHAAYQWQEYMLRHEQTGAYCQLAVYEGHWLLLEPAGRDYRVIGHATGRGAYIDEVEDDYHIYNSYQPRVLYAAGEFDWDFRDDAHLTITEYIAPPRMLVREKEPGKGPAKWYKGEHLEPGEVATAFGVPRDSLPYRSGVGAVQPAPGQTTWPTLRTFSLLMMLLVVLTQLALLFIKPEKQLLREEFSTGRASPGGEVSPAASEAMAAGSNTVLVSKPFEVTGPAALQFELASTTLYNQWLEVPVTLVNERTGQSYEFTKNLEFYTGVEQGETWREGDTDQEATLAGIPSGRYHLTLYPVTENGMDLPLRLTASQHTPLQSNGILALLLLALYPAVQYWRRHSHDATRWQNSDYGPTDNS